jgi:hypothetical protein
MAINRYNGIRRVFIDGHETKEVKSVLMRFDPFQPAITTIELYAIVKEEDGVLHITTTVKIRKDNDNDDQKRTS